MKRAKCRAAIMTVLPGRTGARVAQHLACRVRARESVGKRVFLEFSVAFSGKCTANFAARRRTRIICQLGFSALRKSGKVTPGVFIFPAA